MSLAQGNNTPTRPRIEPGSPDPESDALTTRPVRPPELVGEGIIERESMRMSELVSECSEWKGGFEWVSVWITSVSKWMKK